MDPTLYQSLRSSLIPLLKQAEALPDLEDEDRAELETASLKLLEGQFEITLVGEFQGGKSTTFNTFCDARELSPRGANGGGLKTSGCILRATHLADHSQPEHARVRWRSPQELTQGFDAILRNSQDSSTTAPAATKGSTSRKAPTQTPFDWRKFDPSSKSGRQAIRNAADAELKLWADHKHGYAEERLDLIRFALITAHFYDHPEVRKLRSTENHPLEDIASLIKVPEDWLTRWGTNDPNVFSPREVAFAFVASIDLRIHSQNLGRLGCAITDCPGLHASTWDNHVATQAIKRADAVLYLVPGHRTLPLDALQSVRALPMARGMILVGANIKDGLSRKQAERVIAQTTQLLRNADLGVEEQNIRLYHAELGLLTHHLTRGIENIDPITRKALAANLSIPAGPTDLQELTKRLERRVERHYNGLTDSDEDYSAALLPKALTESRIQDLLGAAELFVLEKKAAAILSGNAERVHRILTRTESDLQQIVQDADKSLAQSKEEFERADKVLAAFIAEADQQISALGLGVPEDLAQDVWSDLEYELKTISDEVAEKLMENVDEISLWETLFEEERNKIVKRLGKTADRLLSTRISRFLTQWTSRLTIGAHPAYERFRADLRRAKTSLRTHWEKTVRKQVPSFDPDILEKEGIETISALVSESLLGEFMEQTLIASLRPFDLIIEWLRSMVGFSSRNDLEIKLSRAIQTGIRAQQEMLISEVEGLLETQFNQWRTDLQASWVNRPRKAYERKKQGAQRRFEQTQADRQQAADNAREKLQTHIEPLRKQCEDFLRELRASSPGKPR